MLVKTINFVLIKTIPSLSFCPPFLFFPPPPFSSSFLCSSSSSSCSSCSSPSYPFSFFKLADWLAILCMAFKNSSYVCAFFFNVLLYICVWVHTCRSAHVEVREQHVGVTSFLPPCEAQRSNSGPQAWWLLPFLVSHPAGPYGPCIIDTLFGDPSRNHSYSIYITEEQPSFIHEVILFHQVCGLGRSHTEQLRRKWILSRLNGIGPMGWHESQSKILFIIHFICSFSYLVLFLLSTFLLLYPFYFYFFMSHFSSLLIIFSFL